MPKLFSKNSFMLSHIFYPLFRKENISSLFGLSKRKRNDLWKHRDSLDSGKELNTVMIQKCRKI